LLGNELEVGLFGPKIEAQKNETSTQYIQNVVRRHQSSLLDLRHPDFYKNHEIRVNLETSMNKKNCIRISDWLSQLFFAKTFAKYAEILKRDNLHFKFIV
jgi:hypothetical protein